MSTKQPLIIALIAAVTVVLSLLITRPLWLPGGDGHDHGGPSDGHPDQAGHGRQDGHAHGEGEAKSGADEPIRLSARQMADAGIEVQPATMARLATTVTLPGEIRLNEDRTAHVVPRVAGVVESVQALLGQPVRKGQVMAVIASTTVSEQRAELDGALRRQALARITFEREKRLWEEKISAEQDYQQARAALEEAGIAVANARQKLAAVGISPAAAGGNRFELRAPFDGIVLEKHVALGEAVRDDTNLFIVSDLSTVWANFNAAAGDLAIVRVGARASVQAPSMNASARGTVSYVGNLIGESTRTAVARVTVPNPQGAWRPGLFVNVTLESGNGEPVVTVPDEAVQTLDGKPHVFVRTGDGFQARAVHTGRGDGRRIEITAGLQAGEQVAGGGSFVLKSELQKGAAEHTH